MLHAQNKPSWRFTKWKQSYKAGHNDKNGQYLGGTETFFVLAAYNQFMPVKYDKDIEHIIGMEVMVPKGRHPEHDRKSFLPYASWYKGALFAIRNKDQTYRLVKVNGRIKQNDPTLMSVVSTAISPFDNENGIYFSGLDPNQEDATNLAWIYKGYVNKPSRLNRIQRATAFRTWTSKSGKTIEAKAIADDGSKVYLQRRSGKRITISRSSLSSQDQRYLNQLP